MLKRVLAIAVCTIICTSSSFAASAKTYQVTGPVLAISGDTITVQKGSDKWEVDKSAATKIKGNLKVGSKVTIEYRMIATSVDVQSAAAAKKH